MRIQNLFTTLFFNNFPKKKKTLNWIFQWKMIKKNIQYHISHSFRFISNYQHELTFTAGIAESFVTKDENGLSKDENELINSDQKNS